MGKNEIGPAGGNPVWQVREQTALAGVSPQTGEPIVPSATDLNLANLVRIASEWRWVILGCVALGLALGLVATLLATPLYRSQATLEMNPPQVEVLGQGKGGGTSMVANDRDFLATQYGLLRSRSLAERVAQELNLGGNPAFVPEGVDRGTGNRIAAGRLQGGFDVDPVPQSRLVEISFVSEDPALAARITNAFADNFINSNLERRYESSAYARRFLQQQINRLKGELENTERRLVAYAQQQNLIATPQGGGGEGGGGGGGSGSGSLAGASLGGINEALTAATTRRIQAEQAYRQSLAVTNISEVNERVAPLRNQLAQLEAEYRTKSTQFQDDYPDMVRLRSQITSTQQAIRAETARTVGSRSNTLLGEFRAAQNAERELQARVNQLKGTVLDERGRSIQYNILQRELDTNRGLYDALLQRYREIGIAGGVGTNTVSVVDRAEPAGGPFTPNLILNLMMGAGIGFALGFLAALGLDILNDVIKSPDDVRNKLGMASLGLIPKKAGTDPLLEDLKDRTSPVSEAYFSLSSALQFTTEHGTPKSLLITSSRAAEGKSSTTLALSQNFARLGHRVLLIDADLRKPAFITGLDNQDGLSKLLTNTDALAGHVLETEFDNLFLLPCGPLPPNPAELLASQRLKALLAEAMQQYDLVIVDGPPVLGLADAPLLASVCRGTLLVVETGKTRTRAAVDAVGRLRSAGAHMVGAVLTKYKQRSHGYGYGYSYEPYRYGGVGSKEREIKLIARREAPQDAPQDA
ncbi:MAG TPA: polysaccharide biosynthesis tyrosine autokinase [Allosphingosinicella sp.]|nr:polysaccharide biosynthesis tyrosine autokinase [Allosphingosinicella sp.]